MALTAKQQRFVSEYLIDLNATQAAIRTGYSKRTARQQGAALLSLPAISEAIQAGQKARLDSNALSADRVLEEYRRIALIDHRDFFDEAGNLKPISQWTRDQGAAVASTETIVKNAQAGDGVTDRIHKLKTWDKVKALGDLAKHFGLLIEREEITGTLEVTWKGQR